ncbi:DUF2783 domain-containing protein [Bosea sp. 685]|uniref:DUF2783 domain-containing protein n=1 Tax=Bosea sp. 685 TaxID=3080057 RepID=UPI00289364B4|nr:DUF2783 domain-containing protein [Bosea sp. 685]WNJ88022.1 DUF2783 domain-containing protein [Bosea sp. 685]
MNLETIAIPDPDDFYEALCREHGGKTLEESAALNIRLVFLLANQIKDRSVLVECLKAAGESGSRKS